MNWTPESVAEKESPETVERLAAEQRLEPADEQSPESEAEAGPGPEVAAGPGPEVAAGPEPVAVPAPARPRAARRPSKPDALLAAAVDVAQAGLLEVAPAEQIGEHLGVVPEAERLVTHRFASHLAGYRGWQWYVTLARVPRGKQATVSEVGLLPSADSLLPREWVPWAERVLPEDIATEDAVAVESSTVVEGPTSDGTAESTSEDLSATGSDTPDAAPDQDAVGSDTPDAAPDQDAAGSETTDGSTGMKTRGGE